MAGLPRKYAKMGFRKGWAAFRSAKKTKKKGASVAKKRRSPTKRARTIIKTVAVKVRRRARSGAGPLARVAMAGASTGAGVIAANAAAEFTPIVRNWEPWQKSLAQAGAGSVLVLATKPSSRVPKFLGFGMLTAATLNLAKMVPQLRPLAGGKMGYRTRLSPAEMRMLLGEGAGMDRPLALARPVAMARPARVASPGPMARASTARRGWA